MPAGQQTPGEEQEARVRSRLVAEGYEQLYGASDDEIRRNLSFRGKCADFVGYHPQLDRWLIAESKGGNLERAELQILNTLTSLLAAHPEATGKTDLQIYISADQYDKLLSHPSETRSLGGYYLRSDDNYLGTYDETDIWAYREIRGIRILAVREGRE